MHGSRFRFLYRCIVVSLYRFLVVACNICVSVFRNWRVNAICGLIRISNGYLNRERFYWSRCINPLEICILAQFSHRPYPTVLESCCGTFVVSSKMYQVSSKLGLCVLRGHTIKRAWRPTC